MTKPKEKTREELQAEIEDGKKKIRQFENREKMLRQKLSKNDIGYLTALFFVHSSLTNSTQNRKAMRRKGSVRFCILSLFSLDIV